MGAAAAPVNRAGTGAAGRVRRRYHIAAGLALVCVAGCAQRSSSPVHGATLGDALFAVAHEWGDVSNDENAARAELATVTLAVQRAAEHDPKALPSELLRRTLFAKLGYRREVADQGLRYVLLPSVLASRRGNCVGLGSVYLAVAERLGWKASGVMMPGHFYVRIGEGGTTHNIELLHRGELMPNAWYPQRFPIPGGAAPEYARALSATEVVAVVMYDVGNQRRLAQRWTDAARAYDAARKQFPDFAEAHASYGSIAHTLGDLAGARAAYEAARRAQPHLPGLADNIALLEQEIAVHAREQAP